MQWGQDGDADRPWWEEPEEESAALRMLDALERQVQSVTRRGVPIRSLTSGPAQGVARLRLADSTTFLVSSATGPHLGRLVRALYGHHALTIATWERSTEGLRITVRGVPGREPAQLWVLGPDQPD